MIRRKERINRDEALSVNRWRVSETSNLEVDQEKCKLCDSKPCIKACPAGCYKEKDEVMVVEYEGCLECGTCRVVCPLSSVSWRYPEHGRGVEYRYS